MPARVQSIRHKLRPSLVQAPNRRNESDLIRPSLFTSLPVFPRSHPRRLDEAPYGTSGQHDLEAELPGYVSDMDAKSRLQSRQRRTSVFLVQCLEER